LKIIPVERGYVLSEESTSYDIGTMDLEELLERVPMPD
jgi:hypothetical protein